MKTITTYIYLIAFVVLCIALLALGGCTKEAGMNPIAGNGSFPADGTRLTVCATASGFQLPAQDGGNNPATRIPLEEGLTTTFQPGDAIGLFCIRTDVNGNSYISVEMKNLKLVCTRAADGTTTWQTEEGANGPVYYTDARTYVAYYPYKANLSTSANDEQALRTELKTLIQPNEDQSTPESLTAGDLMMASGSPVEAAGKHTLTLNFKHEHALLIVKPMGKGTFVPPAGVTAYSYHAALKGDAWGMDKNVEQAGKDISYPLKINEKTACRMSDGTYRVLAQATTSASQIDCNYYTYGSDGSGLIISPSSPSLSGGFKSNTCYTLEVHVADAVGEVERAVQPGDFVYQHNGKIEIYPGDGPVDANGKIPDYANAVGIVVTTDPARMTDAECSAKGWNHAYVMGVKNIPGDKILWMKNSSFSIPYPPVAHMSTAETYMNGYAETEMMMAQTPLSDFPIFEALKQYRDNNAVPVGINRSPWFIPSIGQWFDVLINLCGKSPHDFESNEIVAAGSWGLWQSSRQQKNEMLAKANSYLAKVGATFLMLSSSDIGFWLTSHFTKGYIWVFFGTDTTGVFSIEYMPGANISSYHVSTAVARPFFAF